MFWAGAALSVPRSELGLRALEWSGNALTVICEEEKSRAGVEC